MRATSHVREKVRSYGPPRNAFNHDSSLLSLSASIEEYPFACTSSFLAKFSLPEPESQSRRTRPHFSPCLRTNPLSRWVDQPEHIVKDIVVPSLPRLQLKGLRVAHRPLLLFHEQGAGDDDEDAAVGVRGLSV